MRNNFITFYFYDTWFYDNRYYDTWPNSLYTSVYTSGCTIKVPLQYLMAVLA